MDWLAPVVMAREMAKGGAGGVALSVAGEAEQAPGLGLLAIRGDDSAVDRLGSGELAGLLEGQPLSEFGGVGIGHEFGLGLNKVQIRWLSSCQKPA